jgi:hypothetical protein
MLRLHQGFAAGEMGFMGQVARQQPRPLMSALGQKRTSRYLFDHFVSKR